MLAKNCGLIVITYLNVALNLTVCYLASQLERSFVQQRRDEKEMFVCVGCGVWGVECGVWGVGAYSSRLKH